MILACFLIWCSGACFGLATAWWISLPDEREQSPWDLKDEVEETP